MPYVSFFFGIVIRMFYREHNPPHFHAEYQGQEASFDFDGNITEGGGIFPACCADGEILKSQLKTRQGSFIRNMNNLF